MSLTLYYHPLSSFCHKVLIALYENATPFTTRFVDLGKAEDRAAFAAVWPIRKFPVIRDEARAVTVPESTVIIEYLSRHYPGPAKLVPDDPEGAARVREVDRFYDLHIHLPMQKIVGDRLRPEGRTDPHGVDDATRRVRVALGMVDNDMASRTWAAGDDFTMADCAAAPALFYIDKTIPLAAEFPSAARYLERLKARPSYARTLKEAEPYFHLFPKARAAA
jgi:glutathione S-transferase